MPNQTGNSSRFFDDVLEILLSRISIDEKSKEYKQLVAEENMLWANATDDDLNEYAERSAKILKSNRRVRLISARKKRDKAKKAVTN